jgi:hypothetical protein
VNWPSWLEITDAQRLALAELRCCGLKGSRILCRSPRTSGTVPPGTRLNTITFRKWVYRPRIACGTRIPWIPEGRGVVLGVWFDFWERITWSNLQSARCVREAHDRETNFESLSPDLNTSKLGVSHHVIILPWLYHVDTISGPMIPDQSNFWYLSSVLK